MNSLFVVIFCLAKQTISVALIIQLPRESGISSCHVGPDVEEEVPAKLEDFKDHDDGNPGKETERTSKSRNQTVCLKQKHFVLEPML